MKKISKNQAISIRVYSVFIKCVKRNSYDFVQQFINEHQDIPKKIIEKAFIAACENSTLSMVKLLLSDKRFNPSMKSNEAFVAATNNTLDIVQFLLNDKRVDPSDNQNRAFINACLFSKDIEIIKTLLNDPRIDPSDQDNIAFIKTCRKERIQVIKLLLSDSRINPNAKNNTAFIEACYTNIKTTVKLLLNDKRFSFITIPEKTLIFKMQKEEQFSFNIIKLLYQYPELRDSINHYFGNDEIYHQQLIELQMKTKFKEF